MCDSQAHDEGEQCLDRFSFQVVPVLVLPGVAGSRLRFAQSPHWDPDASLQMLGIAAMLLRDRAEYLADWNSANVFQDLSSAAATAISSNTDLQGLAKIWLEQQGRGNPYSPGLAAEIVYKERGWGGCAWDWYGQLLTQLEINLNVPLRTQIRYPVYGAGYDWRKSNLESAAVLRTRIDAILDENPSASRVILVTHSMGGLVARAAVARGVKSKVLGIVHTVMPSAGAPQHYRRFHTGFKDQLDGPATNPKEFISNLVFGRIVGGGNGAGYALIMGRLRGPMELLPTPKHTSFVFWRDGLGTLRDNTQVANLYDEYRLYSDTAPGIIPRQKTRAEDNFGVPALPVGVPWPIWRPSITTEYFSHADGLQLKSRINDAEGFYNTVFANETPHPNTYVIYATDVKTDIHYDWTRSIPPVENRASQMNLGDGTVPKDSARFSVASAVERHEFSGIKHSECFKDALFRDRVERCVRKILQRAVCQPTTVQPAGSAPPP